MDDNSYIVKIANQIAGRISTDHLPEGDLTRLFLYYAVLHLAKAPNVTNEDVHDAWSAWASEFDVENLTLVPFNQLDYDTQQKDSLYRDVINSDLKN